MAVIRRDDPEILVADSITTLDRVLAVELVAKTPPEDIEDAAALAAIRAALLDEQWGTSVAEWIGATGIAVDVWTDRVMWDREMLDAEFQGFEFQFSPVFRD